MHTKATRAADMEPIPGYRLQYLLGQGGCGEVWRCEAPGGLLKAIKFVSDVQETDTLHSQANLGAVREHQSLDLIKAIRHPFLLSVDRVEFVDDQLVIVTELADQNLHEVLLYYQSQGKQGLPRPELLRYMRETAEVLDLLNLEHGLQHLDIKPQNLFLVNRHVKVGDFGLVSSLANLQGQADGSVHLEAISPLYASPESFLGQVTSFTDQYSLAITYHELLTGVCPFPGKNIHQLALQRLQGEPDLSRLSPSDRTVLQRALAREPRDRFPCCMDMVEALESGNSANVSQSNDPTPTLPTVQKSTKAVDLTTPPSNPQTPNTDILKGYRFLECVGQMPVGEVWKAESNSGNLKNIKLLGNYATDEHDLALRRFKSLRHKALVPYRVLRDKHQRLALISPWIDANLASHLKTCQDDGREGIPREELLEYLALVATALDELQEKYQLQHLALSPKRVLLEDGELMLADFGLAELFWQPMGHSLASYNPRYSAPELFHDEPSNCCDQYSLALIYAELLTGSSVFRNLNPRQPAKASQRGQPDLGMVPAKDRPVLQRALSINPRDRFETCREMVEALASSSHQGSSATHSLRQGSTLTALVHTTGSADVLRPPSSHELLTGFAPLWHQVADGWEPQTINNLRYLLRPGEMILHNAFFTGTSEMAKLKLNAFRDEWDASMVVRESQRFVLHVMQKAGLFGWWGRERGLELTLRTETSTARTTAVLGYSLTIDILGDVDDVSSRLLKDLGPQLIVSLRRCLQAGEDRRPEERFPLKHPVEVFPLVDNQFGEGVSGETFNFSQTGLGLVLPFAPSAQTLGIQIHSTLLPGEAALVPGEVVYATPRSDGRYCVGVALESEH